MAKRISLEALADPMQHIKLLNAMMTQIDDLTTAVNEINTWAETLATKLNADGGVTDENYDAVIAADEVSTQVNQSL